MSSKVIFVIAFLAVITGIYGVVDSLFATTESATPIAIEPQVQSEETYITLWRAKQALHIGKPLTAEAVEREQVALSDARLLGVKQDISLNFKPTTLMNTTVKAGELVFPEYQTTKDQPGYLDLLVSNGMTLYPLTISSRNLIAGYIKPGDNIDIMAISSPKTNLSNTTSELDEFEGVKATLLLAQIRVMSVGSDSEAINPQVRKNGDSESTIVIEVKPDDLAKLALAQRTMYLEIVRSQYYRHQPEANVSDVVPNYSGIVELRGNNKGNLGELF
ncbi:Flp pilus assembly protein CpaB [Photobacterium sp. SDRW27]|uniref:Flp pilus assembly protein CpaB n=1 Tax=Photobacterium obscurum TaxID=2829490 RepID=UPI0022435DB5|nr:Flp pilus assembly protein CpaB [Photobacterium obscurum]MCW8327415.1 Flp pilus assembly protein CpaB [Photobacterium obscurum]